MTGGPPALLASGEVVLADHPLLFAVPVLVPTLVVVLLVAVVVVRDRRRGELDDMDLDPSDPRRTGAGGRPAVRDDDEA